MAPTSLPSSAEVDVPVLARLLDDCTNSYKYLLLLTVIDHASKSDVPGISREQAVSGMVLRAWTPFRIFRLSFGHADQIPALIERVTSRLPIGLQKSAPLALGEAIAASFETGELEMVFRYVPQRLIRPFFEDETASLRDQEVDSKLRALSKECFEQRRPLYRIENGQRLVLHPAWRNYLRTNWAVLEGWVLWHWAGHMQARNPSTPAVASKLTLTEVRPPVSPLIRNYWDGVVGGTNWTCPYSDERLTKPVHLDHVIPWTFVAHHALWNLVPALPQANFSKGDALPDESYYSALCERQARALASARKSYGENSWRELTDAYVSDLGVDSSLLWGPKVCAERLKFILAPKLTEQLAYLTGMAHTKGFRTGWKYKPADVEPRKE